MTAVVSTIFGKGSEDNYGCVIFSDRMLSYGEIGLETPGCKLTKIVDNQNLRVVIGAAGRANSIEDLLQRIQEAINDKKLQKENSQKFTTVRSIAQLGVTIINETIKENMEEFLIPYGKSLKEVANKNMPDVMLRYIGATLEKAREKAYADIEVIISGVDKYGPHIFRIGKGGYEPSDGVGYDVAGSGFDSANWILMHQAYDPREDLKYALFMTEYAKIVAEESLGVGTETDGFIITKTKIKKIEDSTLESARKVIEKMITKERNINKEYLVEFRRE